MSLIFIVPCAICAFAVWEAYVSDALDPLPESPYRPFLYAVEMRDEPQIDV